MAEEVNRAWKDQYMLRLPDGMRDRLKAAAAANGRSMNAEIMATLELAYPADDVSEPGEPMDADTYASYVADEDEIWKIIRTVDDLKDKLIKSHQEMLRLRAKVPAEKTPIPPSKG